MTQPPFGQPAPPPGYGGGAAVPPPPGYGPPPGAGPQSGPPPYGHPQQVGGPAPGQPAPSGGSRRGVKLAAAGLAGLVGLGIVGGGAAFAWSKIDGGGPQPEEALPASTVAFAKVDLDPSAGQKVDAYRFARKFPGAKDTIGDPADDADLRKVVFDAIQKDGGLSGLDYATDVEPWLGDRFAVAVLPTAAGEAPQTVVALAATDADAARAGLGKVTSAEGGYCTVPGDYAICGEDQSVVDKAVNDAKGGTLADADGFSEDMDALGEDGLVTAWVDSAGLAPLASSMATGAASPTAPKVSGRTALALRFDGPHLELVGSTTGTPDTDLADSDGTSVGSLPEDTVAALSIRNVGPAIEKQWSAIDSQGQSLLGSDWTSTLDEIRTQTGLAMPDDLVKLLGDDTTVSLGRPVDGDEPVAALRTNGDKGTADSFVSAVSSSGGVPVTRKDGPDGTLVIATDDAYGQHVASGSGLGDSDSFREAVPDADGASAVAYVDIAAVVDSYGQGMSDEDKENLRPLSAVGMSSSSDGDRGEFRLRLTTR